MEEGILVPIAFFLAIFAILYVFFTSRTKERLALVDKGMDVNAFRLDPKYSKYNLLKWGIFMIGVGVGVFAGNLFSTLIEDVAAYFTMILLFGGIALVIAYLVTSKLMKKE